MAKITACRGAVQHCKDGPVVDNPEMDAEDYLNNYLPDYDTEGMRKHLQQFPHEELIEMLIIAYKRGRVMAMTADLLQNKLNRIEAITQEQSLLPSLDRPPSNFPE